LEHAPPVPRVVHALPEERMTNGLRLDPVPIVLAPPWRVFVTTGGDEL
jgi:hypothetical protein